MSRKVAWDIKVAGISLRTEAAARFIAGTFQRLEIEREPDNPVDANALKIFGSWFDSDGKPNHEHLGYVPREIAESVQAEAEGSPLAVALRAMFPPHDGKGPGLRMDIWTTRRRTKKAQA